jgi:hypothetical protein
MILHEALVSHLERNHLIADRVGKVLSDFLDSTDVNHADLDEIEQFSTYLDADVIRQFVSLLQGEQK